MHEREWGAEQLERADPTIVTTPQHLAAEGNCVFSASSAGSDAHSGASSGRQARAITECERNLPNLRVSATFVESHRRCKRLMAHRVVLTACDAGAQSVTGRQIVSRRTARCYSYYRERGGGTCFQKQGNLHESASQI